MYQSSSQVRIGEGFTPITRSNALTAKSSAETEMVIAFPNEAVIIRLVGTILR